MAVSLEECRRIAFAIIRERCFKRGTFTLASGKTSDFYLDMKPAMFHPEGSWAISRLLLEKLRATKVQMIGGLELGAVPLIATLAATSHVEGHPLHGFFVRKAVKDHGTMKLLEGVIDVSEVKGKAVAILDDVTTTGGSAMVAVEAARRAGADVQMVLSVVDRLEGARQFYDSHKIGFASVFDRNDFMRS